MTGPKRELTKTEQERLEAEYNYLIKRIQEIAELLGISSPILTRKERRQSSQIDQSDS